NSVPAAVWTTTPTPLPARTTVPMNAHDGSSSGESGFVTGSTFFSAGADSPVRTDSSHSSPSASSSRRSAGTTSPTPMRTTSPGTSSVTSTTTAVPSRSATMVCLSCECSASTARAERYSLTNPSPTLSPLMRKMMIASVRSPKNADATAVARSRSKNGLRSCPRRTAIARAPWLRSAFGPTRSRRAFASVDEMPSLLESRARNTSSARIVAASASSTACRVSPFALVASGTGAPAAVELESSNGGIRDLIQPHRLVIEDDDREAGPQCPYVAYRIVQRSTDDEKVDLQAASDFQRLAGIAGRKRARAPVVQSRLNQLEHAGVLMHHHDRRRQLVGLLFELVAGGSDPGPRVLRGVRGSVVRLGQALVDLDPAATDVA